MYVGPPIISTFYTCTDGIDERRVCFVPEYENTPKAIEEIHRRSKRYYDKQAQLLAAAELTNRLIQEGPHPDGTDQDSPEP